jgi:hypothetical protein
LGPTQNGKFFVLGLDSQITLNGLLFLLSRRTAYANDSPVAGIESASRYRNRSAFTYVIYKK